MKALTLWQPYASLVALGVKTLETRSWQTSYRGPLAIHAAKRKPDLEMLEDGLAGQLYDERSDAADPVAAQWDCAEPRDYFAGAVPTPENRWSLYVAPDFDWHPMPLGAVVATCELVDCLPIVDQVGPAGDGTTEMPRCVFTRGHGDTLFASDGVFAWSVEDQRPYGDFTPGRFAWLFSDIKPVDPPVPATGHQGLWNWEERP